LITKTEVFSMNAKRSGLGVMVMLLLFIVALAGIAAAGANKIYIDGSEIVFRDSVDQNLKVRLPDNNIATPGYINMPEAPGSLARLNDDITGDTSGDHTGTLNGVTIGNIVANDGWVIVGTAQNSELKTVAMSGDTSITNAGAMTVSAINGAGLGVTTATDGNILVATAAGGGDWVSVTPSNDIGVANSGAMTIQAAAVEQSMMAQNSIGIGQMLTNGVTLTFGTAGGIANAIIENYATGALANSAIMGVWLNTPDVTVGNIPSVVIYNGTTQGGALLTGDLPATVLTGAVTFIVRLIRP
jgi:hypothetical protein